MGLNDDLLKAAAACLEEPNRVLELIRRGADVHATTWRGETALHLAAEKGYRDICQALLDDGAAIASTRCGRSPLTLASENGKENVIRLLLEKGAHPNLVTMAHGTALDIALARRTDDAVITLLVDHGADVNHVWNKRTPLHWACEYGRHNVVELLFQKGANMEAADKDGQTPVDIARRRDNGKIVDLFEKRYWLWLRLYHASRIGNYDECEALLELGALVDSSQRGLFCPLAGASSEGHYQIVQLLLQKQPVTNNKDNNERNPLYLATKNGHADVVSLLLDKGAKGNVKVNGDNLLHLATRNSREDLVRLLIQNGVDSNARNNDGCAPLHFAAINGSQDTVACLLFNGANVNLGDVNMETPLHLACRGGHERIIRILLENGAKKVSLNHRDETPMDIVNEKLEVLNTIKELLMPPIDAAIINEESANGDQHPEATSFLDCSIIAIDAVESNLVSGNLKIADAEELKFKMDRLSDLISKLDKKVVDLELAETDLTLETDRLKNLNKKIEKNRPLKAGKDYEYIFQELSRRVDDTKRKEVELTYKVEKIESDIRLLKVRVQNICREISRFIK